MPKEEFNSWLRQLWRDAAIARAERGLRRWRSDEAYVRERWPSHMPYQHPVEDTAAFIAEAYGACQEIARLSRQATPDAALALIEARRRLFRCAGLIAEEPLLFDIFNNEPAGVPSAAYVGGWSKGPYPDGVNELAALTAQADGMVGAELDALAGPCARSFSGDREACAAIANGVQHRILKEIAAQFPDIALSRIHFTTPAESKRQHDEGHRRNKRMSA